MAPSIPCDSCNNLNEIIKEQKNKIILLESRLRDCVRAYKQILKEKELESKLKVEIPLKNTTNSVKEDESRLSLLETNISQLSEICGKYEQKNLQQQSIIDKLTIDCDNLRKQLHQVSKIEEPKRENKQVIVRNKYTQIDYLLHENKFVHFEVKTVEVQTDFEEAFYKNKKTECAIVAPTHREPNNKIEKPQDVENDGPELNVFTQEENGLNEQDLGTNTVSLFYVNELARKEIELAESRVLARENDCAIRELRWKYNVDTFKLQNKINQLEKHVKAVQQDEKCKPNLTYIRNVLVRYLKTKDKKQKSCMMSALLTALGVEQTTKA